MQAVRTWGLALAFPILAIIGVVIFRRDDRPPDTVRIPEFVRAMMEADFPADGQVHAQARGRFRIEPTTAFCTFRPGYGLDSERLGATLRRMGQRSAHEGVDREHRANVSRNCIPGRSVFFRAVPAANRQGGPYRLILAVWQGDAAWTGAIERPNGTRPEFASARPFRDHIPPLTSWARDGYEREVREHRAGLSIRSDMADLSRAVLARIARDGG